MPNKVKYNSNLYFIVPVWGESFCRLFLDVSLPSHLSPNNIPGLSGLDACHYHIVTLRDDKALIEKSPAYRKLCEIMPVTISVYEGPMDVIHDAMTECYRIGIRLADDRNVPAVMLNPDLIWADGSLTRLEQICAAGHRVVQTTGLRLLKDTFAPQVMSRYLSPDGASLQITSRQLAGLAMKHLHPIVRNHLWEEGEGELMPANLYWRVGDDGILARCFHLHPLLVYPERKHVYFSGTVDDDFVQTACPKGGNEYVVEDSDDILACEISAWEHSIHTTYHKGKIDDIVAWAEASTSDHHRKLVRHPIRFHHEPLSVEKWGPVEARSDKVIDEVLELLKRPWPILLARNPLVLVRRVVMSARENLVYIKNTPDGTITVGRAVSATVIAVFEGYRRFCVKYVAFVNALDEIIFGSGGNPYPWNASWLPHRLFAAEIANYLSNKEGSLLIVVEPDGFDIEEMVAACWKGDVSIGDRSVIGETSGESGEEAVHFKYDVVIHPTSGASSESQQFIHGHSGLLKPGGLLLQCVFPTRTNAGREFKTVNKTDVGGLGSAMVGNFGFRRLARLSAWRLSPVVLEIPLLPLILTVRVAFGAILGGLVLLLDAIGGKRRIKAGRLIARIQSAPDI